MYNTIYSDRQGEGIVLESGDAQSLLDVEEKSVVVAGVEINPGQKTSVCGFFCRELEFLGVKKENNSTLVFFIGNFGATRFYQTVHIIQPDTLFEMFSKNAGRSFTYKDGRWK